MRKLSVLVALLLVAASGAQAKTLDEVLADKGVISRGDAGVSGGGAKVWWDGGTKVEFPEQGFSTKIATLIQTRYEFTDSDSGDNTSSFDVKKARLSVSGSALNKEFDYKVLVDFVGTSDSTGADSPNLLDAYLTWHVSDPIWVRMGQWKTGVSRQYVTEDAKMQFADRSAVSNFFDLGRDTGAAIGGSFDAFTWQLSAFNGSSTGEGQNRSGVDTNHTGIVNLRWDAMGSMDPYSESDVDNTQDMALSLGFAMAYQDYETAGSDSQDTTYNGSASFRYQGWSADAEYYRLGGDAADDDGFYVQGGYFLCPGECEVAVRYGQLSYDEDARGLDKNTEWAVSFNHYWWKHNLKAQVGWAHEKAEKQVDQTLSQIVTWFSYQAGSKLRLSLI